MIDAIGMSEHIPLVVWLADSVVSSLHFICSVPFHQIRSAVPFFFLFVDNDDDDASADSADSTISSRDVRPWLIESLLIVAVVLSRRLLLETLTAAVASLLLMSK